MKLSKRHLPLLMFISIALFSCGQDDESTGPTYEDHEVAFFVDHPNAIIIPTEYQTMTRQRLVKEESKQGATFETVNEQVLVLEASNEYIFSNENTFNITTNTETNAMQDVICRSFLDASSIVAAPVPAQFATMTWQRVLVDGTGAIVPAQFSSYEVDVVINDAQLILQPNTNRNSEIITFRLESGVSVEEHIQDELNSQSISGCMSGDSYVVQ